MKQRYGPLMECRDIPMAGWVELPPAYFITLASEYVAQFHQEMRRPKCWGRTPSKNQWQ